MTTFVQVYLGLVLEAAVHSPVLASDHSSMLPQAIALVPVA
jgi:hypothetical protein